MKALIAVVGLFLFSQAHATEMKRVCYENIGLYVANVKFKIWDLNTNTVVEEVEHRRVWNTAARKCVDYRTGYDTEKGVQMVEVRVERYMFLGNATLRHTCTEKIKYKSAIVWSDGTTVNAGCGVDDF